MHEVDRYGDATGLRSKAGYPFSLAASRWRLSRDVSTNLSWMDAYLEAKLQKSARKALQFYAETFSGGHTASSANALRLFAQHAFVRQGPLERITATDLLSYRATLDRQHEWLLGTLSAFLRRWYKLGCGEIDSDVVALLRGWRLRGSVKGLAVQILCPQRGPLSELEYAALRQNLVDAFETERLTLADLVLVQLFMATGRRPAQLADLKAEDLVETTASDGSRFFLLNVPRRKQRTSGWRTSFKPFALQVELGDAVKDVILENNRRWHASAPSHARSPGAEAELPLFPSWRAITSQGTDANADTEPIDSVPDSQHSTTTQLGAWLGRVVAALNVPSERTGCPLRVFPTRLRRTLASRAARQGYGELVIAELLDHSDTQNVKVYTQNVPEHVDAINEAVARQLAPLAQAFAGVLVDHEGQARRGSDPTSRLRGKEGSVGTCGHQGFCGAAAPIACYTCRNFQPWLDGVHAEVLQSLLAERERNLQITQDKQMAAINDRTIFAVTEVVQHCEARRQQLAEGVLQ